MNNSFYHYGKQNKSFDVLNSDSDSKRRSIQVCIIIDLDKPDIRFDNKRLPSNRFLNNEAKNHKDLKSFKYRNKSENFINKDNQIKPLSSFVEDNSKIHSVLKCNQGGNDTINSKHSLTKEICNCSGKVVDSKYVPDVKNSRTINDPLPKNTRNQSKKVDKALNKTKNKKPAKKELSKINKRSRKFGYSRCGRKKDCQMFSVLRQLCKQENVEIEDFYTDHAKISTQHDCILMDLVSQMNWRGDTQSLLKRIHSLTKDQTLSIRQIYDLKRLKRKAKQKKKEFVLEDVVDSFPGKSISTLQSAFKIYPSKVYKMKFA